jgi:hypothetical protein
LVVCKDYHFVAPLYALLLAFLLTSLLTSLLAYAV